MKLIIAGSRSINRYGILLKAILDLPWLDPGFAPEIVSGGAKGVDTLAIDYATLNGLKCTIFKADWDKYGRTAGIIRNKEMGNYADCLLVVWDGKSSGTHHMIDYMRGIEKPVHVYTLEDL